jgi:hypothetical protein
MWIRAFFLVNHSYLQVDDNDYNCSITGVMLIPTSLVITKIKSKKTLGLRTLSIQTKKDFEKYRLTVKGQCLTTSCHKFVLSCII